MQNLFDETSLDQLHTLTAKRLATIGEKGEYLTLARSNKAFKGILAQDRKSITFDPATPAQVGAQFEHKTGSYVVLAVADRAGCKCVDVAEVIGTAVVYNKSTQPSACGAVVTVSPAGVSLPILKNDGNAVTVPLRYGNLRGAVLKTASGFMEVTSALIRGAVVELQLTPYREPEMKSITRGPQRPDWLDRAPVKAPWSSTDSYRGW